MPSNKDVQNFFELRNGFKGMAEFAAAALAFMDRSGLAAGGRAPMQRRTNGNGASAGSLIEKVKRHYTARRSSGRQATFPTTPPETTGSKITRQRMATAALLSQLDPSEPRWPSGQLTALGPLVRRGYVQKKGDGYVRTKKEFLVRPRRGSAHVDTNGSEAVTVPQAATLLKMSDANVRLLIKAKKLKSRTEKRTRRGGTKLWPTMVIERAELARYAATEPAAT